MITHRSVGEASDAPNQPARRSPSVTRPGAAEGAACRQTLCSRPLPARKQRARAGGPHAGRLGERARPELRAARPPARAGTACTRACSRVAGSSAGAPAAACSGRAWSDSACHRSPLALARVAEDGADRPRSAPSMDGARSHALQRQVILLRRSCLRARRRPRLSRRARDVTRELWAAPRGRHAPEGAFWRVESHREAAGGGGEASSRRRRGERLAAGGDASFRVGERLFRVGPRLNSGRRRLVSGRRAPLPGRPAPQFG